MNSKQTDYKNRVSVNYDEDLSLSGGTIEEQESNDIMMPLSGDPTSVGFHLAVAEASPNNNFLIHAAVQKKSYAIDQSQSYMK